MQHGGDSVGKGSVGDNDLSFCQAGRVTSSDAKAQHILGVTASWLHTFPLLSYPTKEQLSYRKQHYWSSESSEMIYSFFHQVTQKLVNLLIKFHTALKFHRETVAINRSELWHFCKQRPSVWRRIGN